MASSVFERQDVVGISVHLATTKTTRPIVTFIDLEAIDALDICVALTGAAHCLGLVATLALGSLGAGV
jgi:hypothetical protein